MTKIDTTQLIQAYARLKRIPVASVMRHAAKDFVRRAQDVTPTASVSRSDYYRATRYEMADVQYTTKTGKVKTRRDWRVDAKGRRTRIGDTWYMHESQVSKMTKAKWKRGGIEVRKIKIRKGWSKATWIGAMRALGMPSKQPAKSVPAVAADRSQFSMMSSGLSAQAVLVDAFRIDRFGRSSEQPQYDRISAEGFRAAANFISKDYNRIIREAWR